MNASAKSNRLQHQPLPELAAALRSRVRVILTIWSEEVRKTIPQLRDASEDDVLDHLPIILPQIAAAIEKADGAQMQQLMDYSPSQGMARFHQNYSVAQVFHEDRVLRHIILVETADALQRPMTGDEQTALNTAIDLMLQQSVISYVNEQQSLLKEASESELKHISFLSHDLRNNLNMVTLSLQLLRQELVDSPGLQEAIEDLDSAQQAILDTVGGMARLLQSERLKRKRTQMQKKPIDLQKWATNVCNRHASESQKKGLNLMIDVPDDLIVEGDSELLAIVLQNLLGNAIKYSSAGTVRVNARMVKDNDCELSVADQGPGIPREYVNRIFDAFSRGETHEQDGVGLGLSVVSRAAKLLGGTLSVETKLGTGSTFALRFPVQSA